MTKSKYPEPAAKAAPRVFFRPDNSMPGTHTVIVSKKQIKEMRGEKIC